MLSLFLLTSLKRLALNTNGALKTRRPVVNWTRRDYIESYVDSRADAPPIRNGTVEHGRQRLEVFGSLYVRCKGTAPTWICDLIERLQLNNYAVVERNSAKNRPREGAGAKTGISCHGGIRGKPFLEREFGDACFR
jgi:hypothetical protein